MATIKKNQRIMAFEVDHDGPAYFISKYRNFRWVGKSQRTINNGEGDPQTIPGVSVNFEECVAAVPTQTTEDMHCLTMMLLDPAFGSDYCIDPADRSGFWKAFREKYPDEALQQYFPTGALPDALKAEMAVSVAAQIAQAVPGSTLQRNVIIAAKGNLPIKDGGRERFTEEQEAEFAKLQGA